MSETNHIVSLEHAASMTHAYQSAPEYTGKTIATKISASAYQEVINQPECKEIRTYFALDNDSLTTVVVGVDALGNDITSGIILDNAEWCPDKCNFVSALKL